MLQGQLDRVRGDRVPLGSAEFDTCERRPSTRLFDTRVDWSCTREQGVVLDGGTVEAGLRRTEELALGAGCTAYVNETQGEVEDADWLIETYWRQLRDRPGYSAADLPSLRYHCPDGVDLDVDSTDDGDDDPWTATRQNPPRPLTTTRPDRDSTTDQVYAWQRPTDADVDRLWQLQQGHELTLVLTVSQTYWSD